MGGEFLRQIRSNPAVDQRLRNDAHFIPRHFPEPYEIKWQAKISACDPFMPWLAPESASPASGAQGRRWPDT